MQELLEEQRRSRSMSPIKTVISRQESCSNIQHPFESYRSRIVGQFRYASDPPAEVVTKLQQR